MEFGKNFCMIPFIHLAANTKGQLKPCCVSNVIYNDNGEELKLSEKLDDIWNSDFYIKFRQSFLNNIIPKECERCIIEEKSGKMSKRLKTIEYFGDTFNESIKYGVEHNGVCLPPQYLDLRMGNTCNLKCIMCNPSNSSSLQTEYKLWDEGFRQPPQKIEKWFDSDNFKENMNIILPNLKQLYMTGGEPTIIPKVKEIIKQCVDTNNAKNIFLRFNTNLTEVNEDFYSNLEHFKFVSIGPSIDAINDRLKYVRYPLDWNKVKENIKKINKVKGKINININCTVSLYTILYIDEYLEEFALLYNDEECSNINFEYVHEPYYLNPNILTDDIKKKVLSKIDLLLKTKINESLKISLRAMSKLMMSTPKNVEYARQKFKGYTNMIDKIRNQSFIKTFPELKEMV